MKSKIKNIIKTYIPDNMLEKYRNMKRKAIVRHACICHRSAFLYTKESGKIIIVFIVYQPQLWNSLKTVYEAALIHPDVIPYVIVTGGETRLSDNSNISALSYYKSMCDNVIDCTCDDNLFDLRTLKPDFIFRQTPYDEVYPKEYSMRELSKFSKTCYVPYNYNFSPSKHLRIEYGIDLLANLFAVFSESESNANYCRDKANNYYPDLHVFCFGFPRFDLMKRRINDKKRDKNVFMWIPRWSVDEVNNDSSSFFKYNDSLLEYFRAHQQLKLIIRPHPLMFDNFVKLGIMTNEDVEEYKSNICKENNVWLDDNIDYLDTFFATDVLIADMSSINYEFYLTGKPMIYCGDPSEFNAETKKMMEYSYTVSNWEELEQKIDSLSNGEDPTFYNREKDVNVILSNISECVGHKIIDECVSIIRKKKAAGKTHYENY